MDYNDLQKEADREWGWVSSLVRAHPKTTIFVGIVLIGLAAWLF